MSEEDKGKTENTLTDILAAKINVAELVDEDTLMKIGKDVVEGHNSDLESMADWLNVIEEGFKLIKTETQPKSEPWDNAANFKSPVIIDAALKFGDRASSELLRGDEILKTKVVGKDPEGEKKKRGERVSTYMNWQLLTDMSEWTKEQNKLLYDLPYTGCIFKKPHFSSVKQRNVSKIITHQFFSVNNNASSLEAAQRFTHIMPFSKNEAIERQRGGIWLDDPLPLFDSDGEDESQAEGDDISTYLEQQTYIDLDGDGYKEPYAVLVHESTSRVLRIIPRFDESGVLLKKGDKSMLLSEAKEIGVSLSDAEVIKITPAKKFKIIKYGFLHNPAGGLLDVGYFHLLSGVNGAINMATNQLLNAGSLANMQTGFLAKGFREKLGVQKVKPGEYTQTNISAKDLHEGIRDQIFKEPSPTLFQLNQFMLATAEKTSASADLSGALGANAPATTTLALVQEQQQSSGAIIMRIYRAETEEFKALYALNSEHFDEEEYKRITDDEDASIDDFDVVDMNIIPTANPEVSSKIQRLQLAQAELSQVQLVQAAGGNIKPIVKSFYESIGTQNIDDIFPEPTEEQAAEQSQAAQEQAEEQDLIQQQAIDIQERKQTNEDAKTTADVANTEADTIKTLEEAETEDTKNLSNIYTTAANLDEQAINLEQQISQQQANTQ